MPHRDPRRPHRPANYQTSMRVLLGVRIVLGILLVSWGWVIGLVALPGLHR